MIRNDLTIDIIQISGLYEFIEVTYIIIDCIFQLRTIAHISIHTSGVFYENSEIRGIGFNL